jgi:mitochondrial fission process protein 1
LRVAQEMTRETSKAQLPMQSLSGNDDEIRLSKEYRWTAYSSASTKLFRYLSYTSDFGEAIKPVTQVRFVHFLHIISIGYCIADIGLEAYNLRCRGYVTKENKPISAQRYILQRSVFQVLSTIIFPYGIINATIGLGNVIVQRAARFQRYGPSILALCVIPLIPRYIDKPIEEAIEYIFDQLSHSCPKCKGEKCQDNSMISNSSPNKPNFDRKILQSSLDPSTVEKIHRLLRSRSR